MSKHAGTLTEILAAEGDVVEAGQALAQILTEDSVPAEEHVEPPKQSASAPERETAVSAAAHDTHSYTPRIRFRHGYNKAGLHVRAPHRPGVRRRAWPGRRLTPNHYVPWCRPTSQQEQAGVIPSVAGLSPIKPRGRRTATSAARRSANFGRLPPMTEEEIDLVNNAGVRLHNA